MLLMPPDGGCGVCVGYKRNSLAIFGQISAVGVFPDDMLALAADLLAGTPFMLAYGKVYVDGSVYWGPGWSYRTTAIRNRRDYDAGRNAWRLVELSEDVNKLPNKKAQIEECEGIAHEIFTCLTSKLCNLEEMLDVFVRPLQDVGLTAGGSGSASSSGGAAVQPQLGHGGEVRMPPEVADPFREVPEELHDARGPQFVLQPEEVE